MRCIRRLEKPGYMMATKAVHKSGDISSDVPDLCYVHSEDEKSYIGNWVMGFGFVNVEFPKKTTRELTEEEKEKYDGMPISVGGVIRYIVRTKKNLVPSEAFRVMTSSGSIYHFGEADEKNIREVIRESKKRSPLEFRKGVVDFLAIGKGMLVYSEDYKNYIYTSTVKLVQYF